jgi:hypothetical protein
MFSTEIKSFENDAHRYPHEQVQKHFSNNRALIKKICLSGALNF